MIPDEELVEVIKAAIENIIPRNPRGDVTSYRVAYSVADAVSNNYKLVKRDEVDNDEER